jgi:uncharacterized membrane protein YhhN
MVGFALAMGATGTVAGTLFVCGLILSAVGDVFLARSEEDFVRGLAAFLGAHLAYIAGFGIAGCTILGAGFAAVLLLPLTVAVWRRLAPLAGSLKTAVAGYVFVISLMLLFASGSVWAEPSAARQLLLLSAIGFAVSDLCVAEKRFGESHWAHVAVGLPLYYLAQLGIGMGAAGL